MNPHDELRKLTALFPEDEPLFERTAHVAAALTPDPYKRMLAHDHHMTVTMERYHNCTVDVRVLQERRDGDLYARKIVLVKSGTEIPVQFGIVRFDLTYVTPVVREEILQGQVPLGRILINHNVLRHIDLGAILKIHCGPGLARHLACPAGTETYGRLATIFCNHQPAVDLLEISSPLQSESESNIIV